MQSAGCSMPMAISSTSRNMTSVVDLFSDEGEVWFLGGIYKGKAGIRRLYIERFRNNFTEGHNGPRYGWLLDHPQIQMIVDVAPDRKTAEVRGRSPDAGRSARDRQAATSAPGGKAASTRTAMSARTASGRFKAPALLPRTGTAASRRAGRRRRSTSSRWRASPIPRIRSAPTR